MRNSFTRTFLLLTTFLVLFFNSMYAQVNISPGNTVIQNFDGIGTTAVATLPAGWRADKQTSARLLGNYATAVSATEQIGGANISSSATNGIYNFGAGTNTTGADRSVGGISSSSSSKTVNIYVDLYNNGSLSIPGLTLSYDVEKYRGGSNAAGFSIQLYYSTDGSTWTNAGSDFLTSFGADAGNTGFATTPGVSVSVSTKQLPVSAAPNTHLYLAWSYAVSSGSTTSNAQALGIDNVSITAAVGVPPASALTLETPLQAFGSVKVGSGGSVKSFVIAGSDLDGSNISIAPLTGFGFSETGVAGTFTPSISFASGTSFTNKTIFVQFDPAAPQSYNGSIIVSGGGAANLSVPVTGSGNVITPVVLGTQPLLRYTENFSDISNWANNFNAGMGANRFAGLDATGTGSAGNPTNGNPLLITTASTTFVSGTSGGVQKGPGSLYLLATGSTDNTTSVAVDFYMDFTGVNAGTLSFDWASVNNSSGNRNGSLRVYATVDGISFTEITSADVLNFTNNVPSTGTVNSIALPAMFNNSATARLRFYYHNGTGGTTGSRPKISIDNLTVTGISSTPCTTPAAGPVSLSFDAITETTIHGNFVAASPAVNEYLVVMSTNPGLTSLPIDGQTYFTGDNIGDGTVIDKGTDLGFTASGLTGATTYYFFVFPVNSVCTGGPKYLTTGILTDNATTAAGLPVCTAPADQPLNLVTVAGINSVQGSFSANTADEFLVLQSTSATLNSLPVNGTAYSAGNQVGNAIVIQRSHATSFVASGLNPETPYYYFIFSDQSQACLNGPVYNTVSPLTGSATTLPLPACVTPLAQPTNIAFNASNNSITATFNGAGAGYNYLVVVSNASTLSALPADNTDYPAGTGLGGGVVVSNNTSTSFIANNLNHSSTYYFFVFSANKNCTGGTRYLLADPLTGQATTTNAPVYHIYFGNLHAHSDYSDGNKDHPGYTPADDYAYAQNSMGMDFLGISEHNHFSSLDNPGNELANYHLGVAQAAAFNASHSNFLALYGMEWGVISGGGHVVVYGDGMDDLFGWESNVNGTVGPNYDVYVPKSTYLGTDGLFKTINDYVAKNAFATLAHPNNTDFNNLSNLPYDAAADDAISGTAVESGPATSTNTTYSNPASSMYYLWYYQKLLSKGYHLGPTIDHDNHNTTFGRTTTARTAVLAPALTRSDIIKSVRDMHFYATEDMDAQIDFTINTRIMGSVFEDRNAPSISVNLTDPTTATSNALIRVMFGIPGSGSNPVVIDSVFGSSLNYVDNDLPNHATGYYYIDITNGSTRMVTSPIWYTRTCAASSDITVSACDSYTWNGVTYTSSATVSKTFTTAGGCDSTATLHLTINGSPAAAGIVLAGPDKGCPSNGVAFTATAADGGNGNISAYQWLLNGNTVATTTLPAYTAFASGNYSVRVVNDAQCSVDASNSIPVTVTDDVAPVLTGVPENTTVACDAVPAAAVVTALDDCDTGVMISMTETSTQDPDNNQPGHYQYTITRTWVATDAGGNSSTASQIITIQDLQAPVITVPANILQNNDPGNCGAKVYFSATATDNCSPVSVSYTTASGSVFPVGVTTVTVTATDIAGNNTTADFTVTVADTEKPVVQVHGDYTMVSEPGVCGATIGSIVPPVVSDNCGIASISHDHPSTYYPVGTTILTWIVTDVHGNVTDTAKQRITVVDNETPVVMVSDLSVANDPGTCGTNIVLPIPVTSDNCGVATISNNHPSTYYPVGTTDVVWTVYDINGLHKTATQTITVTDTEAPVITGLPSQVFCVSSNGQYSIPVLVTSDNCMVASVQYSITGATIRSGTGTDASGNFNTGTSVINWVVTDIHGNQTVSGTMVTVNTLPEAGIIVSGPDQFCNKLELTASVPNAVYQWVTGTTAVASTQQISLGQTDGDGLYSLYVTVNGCTSAPVSYQYAKQNLVSSYTLLALDRLDLGENNRVMSGSVGVVNQKGEAIFHKNSTVTSPGSFVKARTIRKAGSGINISHPVYSAATGISLPVMYNNTASTNRLSNKEVAANSITTVTGNYKNLVLRKGSRTTVTGNIFGTIRVEQGAQVTFTAASINIENLQVVKGPRYGYSYVRFTTDTKIMIGGKVSIGSQVYINPDNQKVSFYLGDQKKDDEQFSITGGDTKVTANIYLPDGKLKITGGYSYGDYGHGRGDCDRDDEDERNYGKGDSHIYMTGLFIAEQIEANGKNVIWNSFDCGAPAVPVLNSKTVNQLSASHEKAVTDGEELQVIVSPNPSTLYFTVTIRSNNASTVNLRVLDAMGRIVEARSKINANSTLQIGQQYLSGTYFAEFIQGTQRKVVQLLKIK